MNKMATSIKWDSLHEWEYHGNGTQMKSIMGVRMETETIHIAGN